MVKFVVVYLRDAEGPEELPSKGVTDETVDGEVPRGVEHHERVRDVGHDLAPVRGQPGPVQRPDAWASEREGGMV